MADKRKFVVVHRQRQNYGDGHYEDFVVDTHETYAVSEAKAISNVMYRAGYNRYNRFQEWSGDGLREDYFEVEKDVRV